MNTGQLVGVGGFGVCAGYTLHEIVTPNNPLLAVALFAVMGAFGLLAVYSTPRAS